MVSSDLKEYKGHKVDCGYYNNELYFISFTDYDEAYNIMISLVRDGYMIQDLETIEDENRHVLCFNKQ